MLNTDNVIQHSQQKVFKIQTTSLWILWAFFRSYSIICFNINSAGSVFTQIIIGAVQQPAGAFYVLTNSALPAVVIISADVADKFHFIVLTLWKSIIKICKSTHDLVTQWGCPDKPWQKPWHYGVRHRPELADCFTPAEIKLKQRFCFDTPCLATIQMATFSNEYPWTNFRTGQLEITHNTIRPHNKVTFLKTYFFVITQIGCYGVT